MLLRLILQLMALKLAALITLVGMLMLGVEDYYRGGIAFAYLCAWVIVLGRGINRIAEKKREAQT